MQFFTTPSWCRRLVRTLPSFVLPALALHVVLLLTLPLQAKVPEQLAEIQREARIVADVMVSALRREVGEQLRITAVEPQFLVDQGVLMTVSMNTPWLSLQHGGDPSQMARRISIPEIPAMVENILNDLHISMAPYETEALEELRELRDEQRDLRSEQRKIRSDIRKLRRDSVREDKPDKQREMGQDIAALEAELSESELQYDELSRRINSQYERLRNYHDHDTPGYTNSGPQVDMAQLIARSVCDYGANLKTLENRHYLTVALERDRAAELFAFRMVDIRRCSSGDLSAEELLAESFQYEN
ncbi:MAG: hypothetical protein AAF993_00990 [Pseudomonadota bacterium]